jgi:signal transduction histidine kinase
MRTGVAIIQSVLDLVPVAIRLPLLAGVIVFLAAVGTTQIALTFQTDEADRQTERLARVYLDGLAAAIADEVQTGDWAAVERRFLAAFQAQEGVREVALYLSRADGTVLARAAERPALSPFDPAIAARPFVVDAEAGLLWASRTAASNDRLFLTAALDVLPLFEARRRLFGGIVLLDLAIAAMCSVLAYFLLRRTNRTTDGLLALLQSAGRGAARRIPPQAIAGADRQTAPLLAAYNDMADALDEREKLRAEIARRTQAAALGRLAATMAHEVRNPLGGLATAVGTLRKFGDRAEVRGESLAFLERGIETIDSIVSRMLNLHRPEEERRLSRIDFEDLRGLVAPALVKRGLTLSWRVDLPERIALGASGVRQVLLNLLLNACAASPLRGTVSFVAHIEDSDLICGIADEGPGMEEARIRQLTGMDSAPHSGERLGLDAVVSLLGDLEGTAEVARAPGGGTAIHLRIPLEKV